jgi:hypothetical protein
MATQSGPGDVSRRRRSEIPLQINAVCVPWDVQGDRLCLRQPGAKHRCDRKRSRLNIENFLNVQQLARRSHVVCTQSHDVDHHAVLIQIRPHLLQLLQRRGIRPVRNDAKINRRVYGWTVIGEISRCPATPSSNERERDHA